MPPGLSPGEEKYGESSVNPVQRCIRASGIRPGYGGTRLRCQGTNHASGGPAVLSHEPDGEYAEAVYDLRHEQEAGGGY